MYHWKQNPKFSSEVLFCICLVQNLNYIKYKQNNPVFFIKLSAYPSSCLFVCTFIYVMSAWYSFVLIQRWFMPPFHLPLFISNLACKRKVHKRKKNTLTELEKWEHRNILSGFRSNLQKMKVENIVWQECG